MILNVINTVRIGVIIDHHHIFARFTTCSHHGGTKILLILGSATIQFQDTEPSAAVPPGLGGVGVAPAQWPPLSGSQLCIHVSGLTIGHT